MDDLLQKLSEKKKKLDSLRPLPKESEKSFEDWLRVELTYSSNAIEGNTLTRAEVKRLLDNQLKASQQKSLPKTKSKRTDKDDGFLKIGELAKETRETVPAIRHWIEKGLIEVAEHTEAGYQLFDRSMIGRVKEIRKLQKEKRLTIKEIKNRL